MVYDPDALTKANNEEKLYSIVARTPKGDVLGHCALFSSPCCEFLFEEGQLVVVSSYRNEAVAKQLVRRELKTDPGQVLAVVREAMAALPLAARNVRLHLHPEDATLVREMLTLGDNERGWQIVEDPVLSRGGCKISSDTSQIDASVERRLHTVIANVLGGQRETDVELAAE